METYDFDQRRRRAGAGDSAAAIKALVTRVVVALLIVLVVWELFSVFYWIDASDQGVVLRFGAHRRTTEPGLHMKLPWPFERVYKVTVRRIQTLEFGFETERPGRVTRYAESGPEQLNVAEMLTGDLNLAHVEWIVQYRVSDAPAYMFHLGDVDPARSDVLPVGVRSDPNPAVPDTIRDISESVMRRLVGDTSVDATLTFGREEIARDAKEEIQRLLDEFQTGVQVVTVKLQSTSPPEQVKDAFQEVNRARQNKERVVNEAEGQRNRQIPAARGKRDQMISEAEGYGERIVLEARGKTNAFLAQLAEYDKAPDITRNRLYLEAMQNVLKGLEQKTIIDDSVSGVLPLLNLDAPSPVRPSGAPAPDAGSGGGR